MQQPGQVQVPTPDTTLQATYTIPLQTTPTTPAIGIVALHGCGGPSPSRDTQWRDLLTAAGHPTLWPDSFGSRGLGSQCTTTNRTVTPNGKRRTDALSAAQWLTAQPTTQPGGVILIGWSNGGSTALSAANNATTPPGLLRAIIAFYPGCRATLERRNWTPAAPILILIGAADDWTPPEPCRQLAARFPTQIKLIEYPGAYHGFDSPAAPIRIRQGLAYTATPDGTAHTGTNHPARQSALREVTTWIAALPATGRD